MAEPEDPMAAATMSTAQTPDSAEFRATLYRRLPASHPIHSLVGRVASDWSVVEHMLDTIIWRMLKTDDRTAACVTSQLAGSYSRSQAIIALCKRYKLPKSTLDSVNQIHGRILGTQQKRNRILHDAWYSSVDDDETHQFRAMPKEDPQFGMVQNGEAYLSQTLNEIEQRINDAGELSQTINAALP